MNTDTQDNKIQAFPVAEDTFVGTPSNETCNNKIVHWNEDGDITFHFAAGDVIIPGLTGFDAAVADSCTGCTASISVMIG